MFKFSLNSHVIVNDSVKGAPYIYYRGKSGRVVLKYRGILGDNLYQVSFDDKDPVGIPFYENELSKIHDPNLPNLF